MTEFKVIKFYMIEFTTTKFSINRSNYNLNIYDKPAISWYRLCVILMKENKLCTDYTATKKITYTAMQHIQIHRCKLKKSHLDSYFFVCFGFLKYWFSLSLNLLCSDHHLSRSIISNSHSLFMMFNNYRSRLYTSLNVILDDLSCDCHRPTRYITETLGFTILSSLEQDQTSEACNFWE